MAARDLIILGTGGNCVDLLDILDALNAAAGSPLYRCAGFLDDREESWGSEVAGVPVLGGLERARHYPDACFVNGIGSPENFRRKPEILARTGLAPERFVTLVHPAARVSRFAELGRGTVLFSGVHVGSEARLGSQVFVLANAVISHDVRVGDHTILCAQAAVSSGVRVGSCCYLGTHCALRQGVTVGDGALVGMGGVVLQDVEPGSVVAGCPARPLRRDPA